MPRKNVGKGENNIGNKKARFIKLKSNPAHGE